MKISVTLHSKPDQYEESGFCFHPFEHADMSGQGYTALDTVEVEFNVPPRSVLVAGAVSSYRAEIQRIRAEAQAKVTALDEEIQKLLCI